MATLQRDKRKNSNWRIFFWVGGQQYSKSTRTASEREAKKVKLRVEDTLELLATGRISVPDNANVGDWVLRGGKAAPAQPKRKPNKQLNLSAACAAYLDDQIGKAKSTVDNERIHICHLKRVLGSSSLLAGITKDRLQTYVKKRQKTKFRGEPIGSTTIRKELKTFRQIWSWAQTGKIVTEPCPLLASNGRWAVNIPKPKQKLKFQTWDQIAKRIRRGGITEKQQKELWASLFLDQLQVKELLKLVRERALHSFIYPMFVFAAYTGARRSEILRSEIDDFDFDEMQLLIRERKRRKDLESSTRFVPIHPTLRDVMQEWFALHPGGQYTINAPLKMPGQPARLDFDMMTVYMADHHFDMPLKKTKWEVVKGFHVLRHSFGSNLARSGKVTSETIGEWMGHTTEEMRELYQHLFPQDGQQQIVALE